MLIKNVRVLFVLSLLTLSSCASREFYIGSREIHSYESSQVMYDKPSRGLKCIITGESCPNATNLRVASEENS